MSARAPQTKKVFYLRETVKESLTRKTAKYRGWNKCLDLHMTRTPLLQLSISLLAALGRGPNSIKCAWGEYVIAKNF